MNQRALLALPITLAATAACADTVTFEELGVQPPDFSSTGPLRLQYAGLSFTGPTALNGGAILNQAGNFGINARSGEHFLAFNRLAGVTMNNGGNPRDPETITFASLMQSVSIYAAGGSEVATFQMQAFGNSAQLLGQATVSAGSTWELLFFSSAAGIRSVVLTETFGRDAFVYDDLSFTLLPAPGAVALMGLAAAFAGRRRRR